VDGQTHPKCRKKHGLDGVLSLFPYTGVVQRAIKQMKYRFAFRVLGDVLQHANFDQLTRWKRGMEHTNILIIPIPLHVSRQNFRGFNQSDLIAKYIAERLDVRVTRRMLIRTEKTLPQVEMKSRSERVRNMRHVFGVTYARQLPQHAVVLLIDDVFTTGATMRSAAAALKQQGVQTVWGLTIAQ
jgi:ComF family protein